jgi:L-arabinokinase
MWPLSPTITHTHLRCTAVCFHHLQVGYGSVSECLAVEKPLVFVRRDHFNEEPFLRTLLKQCNGAVEISKADLMSGNWAPYLEEACDLKVTYR